MTNRFPVVRSQPAFSRTQICPVCKQSAADKEARIYLDTKLTGYYVVLITFKETFLRVPTCSGCRRKVNADNWFNENGSAIIVGAFAAACIGLMLILIELPSLMMGDYSSLLHSPVIGLILIAPSIWMFLRCFRARKNIKSYLAALGYQKG